MTFLTVSLALLILLNHYSFWRCKSPFLLHISKEIREIKQKSSLPFYHIFNIFLVASQNHEAIWKLNVCLSAVLETPTDPPVWGRQLWRRTRNFMLIFLQFYVYDLRFKPWGPTTFLLSFKHCLSAFVLSIFPSIPQWFVLEWTVTGHCVKLWPRQMSLLHF